MAYALRRETAVRHTQDQFDSTADKQPEKQFPVISDRRTPLTQNEAASLLDEILDEHFYTMRSLAK
jgi:hypothetical protein